MRVILLLLLASPIFAAKNYTHNESTLNAEWDNNYKEHDYPNWVNARGSSATVTYMNVSTAAFISFTATNSTSTFIHASTGTFDALYAAGALVSASKWVQIVFSTNSTSTTSTNTSFVDTSLSAAITPTSTANYVLVIVSASLGVGTNNERCILGISMAGTDQVAGGYMAYQVPTANAYGNGAFIHRTSPNSVSSVTYRLRLKSGAGGTCYTDPTGIQENMVLIEVKP